MFVENKLVDDLNEYVLSGQKFQRGDVKFDWSESCIEGRRTSYLDGKLENFSGIQVLDRSSETIVDGWMEFIETEGTLHVFWWFLSSSGKYDLRNKRTNQVPAHVWKLLSTEEQTAWERHAPQSEC